MSDLTSKNLRYTFSNRGSGRPYSRGCSTDMLGFRTADNTCAIMDGTRVVFASEAERFTKVKHDFRSPILNLEAFKLHPTVKGFETLEEIEQHNADFNHHENHIYECFYQSGFKDAAVIVIDGMGNLDDCVTLAHVKEGERPSIFKKFKEATSPCCAYGSAAFWIFGQEHAEGKLMGLAAYGSNNGHRYVWYEEETDAIKSDVDLLHKDITSARVQSEGKEFDVMQAKDIAFTIQSNFVDVVKHLASRLRDYLDDGGIGTENLCLSGGGILNCPANSAIVDLGFFKKYYASPQPCDGNAESVGWAFRNMFENGENLVSTRLKSAYLGVNWSSKDVPYAINKLTHPIPHILEQLKLGGVISWYQDGAEWGPRALGHRSFLADPSNKNMLDALNRIKGRESWRPLAPIVPDRLFPLIFDTVNTDMCEFMLRTLTIKPEWQKKLAAICHVDGTTRPQLLKKEVNPQLYELSLKWFEETGIPCLINTSLNINGFPIVETPRDLCELKEEIFYIENVPDVMTIFVEAKNYYAI